jgi:hypothetical protein
MKPLLTFLLLINAISALAQGTIQFVSPTSLAAAEGNSSVSDLFVNGGARMMQVYSAADFTFNAPTGRIDAISFRLDGGGSQGFVGTWPSVAVYLSTTSQSPDSLSPVYSANHGADSRLVFGSQLSMALTDISGTPRSFELRIPFTTPFFYDPSKGNLAVDIVTFGTQTLTLDGQFTVGDSVSRVFGPNSASGTVDTKGLVTRFDITPIPEPSLGFFVIIPLLLLAMRRRGRSN